jgi:hypothetical protein
MKWKLIAFFALAALLQPAYAATCTSYACLCGVDSFDEGDGHFALSFIAIAFAFVSTAIALAYMYGRFRQDERAAVWAKDEAQNLLITALLFAGLLVFFTGSCALAVDYSGGSPLSVSKAYISTLLSNTGQTVLRDLTFRSILNQEKATDYAYVGFTPFKGSGVAGYANYRAHSSNKELLIDLYLPIIASLNAQKYLLDMVGWIGAGVLLPFAFVMRIIPFTRDFGNMLIAIFFAAYIVAPTLYALSAHVFLDNMKVLDRGVAVDSDLFYSYGIDAGPQTDNGKDTVLYKIGSTLPQAIFLPNLVIIISITCAMAVSKALRAIAV